MVLDLHSSSNSLFGCHIRFGLLPDVPATVAGEQAQKSPELGAKDTPEPVSRQPSRRGAQLLQFVKDRSACLP